MKSLKIPKIPGLEKLDAEKLTHILEHSGAHDSITNAPWENVFPDRPQVRFFMATSERFLFVRFNVQGNGLKAEFKNTNDPVWQDSCVEFFVEDADGNGYRNFEINCIGTILSAHQIKKDVGTCHISENEAGEIIRFASLGEAAFEEKEGFFEWSVTIGIPWSLLGYETTPQSIRANLYKCADGTRRPHYLCWAPIDLPTPNFHCPEFFGTLTFE